MSFELPGYDNWKTYNPDCDARESASERNGCEVTCPICDGAGGEEDADEDGLCWNKCRCCNGEGGFSDRSDVFRAIRENTHRGDRLRSMLFEIVRSLH